MIKVAAFSLALWAGASQAISIGTHGTTYGIKEVDARLYFMAKATEVDWSEINDGILKKAKTFMDTLEPFQLPPALVTDVKWVSLAVQSTEDVFTFVEDEQGDWVKKIVIPKGTITNPFEKIRPTDRRLYFDGRSEEQILAAEKLIRLEPKTVTLIATAGNPAKLTSRLGMPVYYANKREVERFQIYNTPTLIGAGRDNHYYDLAVVKIGPPLMIEDFIWGLELMPVGTGLSRKALDIGKGEFYE